MILVVCVDERDGMLFGTRRQSRDRRVTERILELAEGRPLHLSDYSLPLFEGAEGLCPSENPAANAKKGEVCFIENTPLPEKGIERLHLICWNRHYPATRRFDRSAYALTLTDELEYAGHSHEAITERIYEVKE